GWPNDGGRRRAAAAPVSHANAHAQHHPLTFSAEPLRHSSRFVSHVPVRHETFHTQTRPQFRAGGRRPAMAAGKDTAANAAARHARKCQWRRKKTARRSLLAASRDGLHSEKRGGTIP